MLETDAKLFQHDFLIAQCNNCFIFFEQIEESLLQPIRDMQLCTEEELESHFSQRNIQ